jgi:hypothetical protein
MYLYTHVHVYRYGLWEAMVKCSKRSSDLSFPFAISLKVQDL